MNVTKLLAVAGALTMVLAGCPSTEEKTCTDFCGAGSACVGETCQAVLYCEPACGTGEACQDGTCVATLDSACSATCAAGQVCVTGGGTAACVDVCGSNQLWNATTQKCELQITMDHSRYFGGFSDTELNSGPAVTAQCLNCHSIDATEMAGSAHFKWVGPTPLLAGHEADTAAVGKKNLINNFCIAVGSNEARCSQCHAGYGNSPAGTPAYNLTGDAALARVDCLICHANLPTSGYAKSAGGWGGADVVSTATGCNPACNATTEVCVDDGAGPACVLKTTQLPKALKAAARSVSRPGRANCGWCHFFAGGGDNVKMGDLGSALTTPAMSADVHMGSVATGGQDLACVDCHVTSQHRIFGAGVSVAVSEGRAACTDCHDTAATAFKAVSTHRSSHLAKLACQTCHIPTFSRQQLTKTRWEWASAGFKDCKFPVTAADELLWGDLDTDGDGYANTTASTPAGPLVCAAISASPSTSWTGADGKHYEYDWRKGVFLKEQGVTPAYRYTDGKGMHLTISDAYAQAGTPADPVVIAAPTATSATVGARIAPFKEMQGTQAGMASKAFLIVPHLFGTDGLWDTTTPKVPSSGQTVDTLKAIWNDVLADGAFKAGQATGLAAEVDFADADWGWVETRMYMNLNHEVAPKGGALGAAGCADCHGGTPVAPICSMPGVSCGW